jgi:hypothetical protein
LQTTRDQLSGPEAKTRLVEQINACLRSGAYSRALQLLRAAADEFPNDTILSDLEKLALNGATRKAEADHLITESQELFAERKSAEAIQLLRRAYDLDKNNSLARTILANALVEHAQSIVETNWLEAETLASQALALNPAHPTAKTLRNLIVEQKQTSSVDDWVEQARKLHTSGDLFAALAWVAEGLAVHPDDPKLSQIQDAIQRDQAARRRQARRGDLEDLRRMELEIDAAADPVVKQALAERIQRLAAKYWTDGEILAIANRLLNQLGLAPPQSSSASTKKRAAIIFHVPRPSAAQPSSATSTQPAPIPLPTSKVSPPAPVPPENVQASTAPIKATPSTPVKIATTPSEPQRAASQSAIASSAAAAQVSQRKQPTKSKLTILILVSAAAILSIGAIFFLVRRHHAPLVAKTPAAGPTVPAPVISAAPVPAPVAPAETTPDPPVPDAPVSSGVATEQAAPEPPPVPARNHGTLLVVAGQDDAKVFLNGKLQRQLTRAGQLRLPNLELKDYIVQLSKPGFQDPPSQKIRIRNDGEATLTFNLQPQPRLASLTIQGGLPGTAVLVDQTSLGTIQPDGTLSIATVTPGDHTIELRKDRFKPRQLKKHFVVGGNITLAAADVALEGAPGELKITFTPTDANVAIAKGEFLKIVSSGVALNLAPGTYTLTARTAERFTRSSTLEVIAGQSRTLDLSLAPGGMSKWDDPAAWRHEKDSFTRKGGDFVLYGAVPASGTFLFSAMPAKGHLLQWVLNYTDSRNYILCQMDDTNFYRTVIRNGQKSETISVPDKGDKKSFRTLQIRVSSTEVVHVIKHGDSWTVLDRWSHPGANLSQGKFGFYIPGNDQVSLASFAHYADLNLH